MFLSTRRRVFGWRISEEAVWDAVLGAILMSSSGEGPPRRRGRIAETEAMKAMIYFFGLISSVALLASCADQGATTSTTTTSTTGVTTTGTTSRSSGAFGTGAIGAGGFSNSSGTSTYRLWWRRWLIDGYSSGWLTSLDRLSLIPLNRFVCSEWAGPVRTGPNFSRRAQWVFFAGYSRVTRLASVSSALCG